MLRAVGVFRGKAEVGLHARTCHMKGGGCHSGPPRSILKKLWGGTGPGVSWLLKAPEPVRVRASVRTRLLGALLGQPCYLGTLNLPELFFSYQ